MSSPFRPLYLRYPDSSPPLEDRLNVITVVSNAVEFESRWRLSKNFIEEMRLNPEIRLYVVELAYGNQNYRVTSSNDPSCLQLRTEVPLWHKESMINLAVRKLLPADWKAFAWIDSDVSFDHQHWASEALHRLQTFDIIQPFSYAVHLGSHGNPMTPIWSCGHRLVHWPTLEQDQKKFNFKLPPMDATPLGFPGFAWAIRREAFEKIGGLFDRCIIGGGDWLFLNAVLGRREFIRELRFGGSNMKTLTENFFDSCAGLRFGYSSGVVYHHFHGHMQKRQYFTREFILSRWNYDPILHLTHDDHGLIIPSEHMSTELKNEILEYLKNRDEDNQFEHLQSGLDDSDFRLFERYLKQSQCYVEFGACGTTVAAAESDNINCVFSIECNDAQIQKLNNKQTIPNLDKVQFLHIPVSDSDGRQYSSALETILQSNAVVNLVYIGGSHRVACALKCFNLVSDTTPILFANMFTQSCYNAVIRYFDIVDKSSSNDLAVLKKKKDCIPPTLEMIAQYQRDSR